MDHVDLLITESDLNAMRSAKYWEGAEEQEPTTHGQGSDWRKLKPFHTKASGAEAAQ